MSLAYGKDERHPMVDALLRTRVPRWEALNLAVDERDDMLDFAIGLFAHDRDRAVTNYFQNALEQFAVVRHIAGWRGPVRRMLDFASGYGRLTRLLVHEKVADEITVADILEGGMQFQAEQFGVRTIVSKKQPEGFVAEGQFDVILVASLFTHLPPATFTPWLRRLAELLTPNGLLIFSVHDQSLAPVKVDGIAFHSYSESRVLEGEDYGSTWVSEEYVREQVASLGAGHDCVRLPRALSDWQDVYVISRAPIPNPSPRRTPKGFVDQFETEKEGVRISGWAVGAGEEAERVEVRLDDDLAAMATHFGVRPDVAAWLGMDAATRSGWEVLIPHSAIRSFRYQVVTISAFTRANEERILFIGTLDSLSGHAAREKGKELERQLEAGKGEIAALHERVAVSEHQRQTVEQQIAAMQQSRFWRARDQWFAMKRRLGLTDEL